MADLLYVRHGRLHYYIRELLKRCRVPATDASKVADTMVFADLSGRTSEGVSRLPDLVSALSGGLILPTAAIEIVQQDQAVSVMDGGNALGAVIGVRAMELAIETAKRLGLGAVGVRHSNDLGIAGYYARMALEEQMIGVVLSNSPPTTVPPEGHAAFVGANPLAIAIPSAETDAPFVVDMATSGVSRHRLTMLADSGESLDPGLAMDPHGETTTDPVRALDGGRYLPLGAPSLAHKGFALALAIDILCGILPGGSFGRELRQTKSHQEPADLGHFFLAMRLRSFTPWIRFRNRMQEFVKGFRKPGDASDRPIYYPGESAHAIEQMRRAEGIPLDAATAIRLRSLASGLDLPDAWEHLEQGKK